MSTEHIIEIKNLSVDYHSSGRIVHAVRNLDLDIESGETIGLVGETGAGKTTMAMAILRILSDVTAKITDGQILYKGEDLLHKNKKEMRLIRGKEISMIFQDPMTSLDPVEPIGKQIEEMLRLHVVASKEELREKACQMLEVVGIKRERFSDYPHQLSGGMKQRVVIAIALSCNPQLLIADEPTTALDVTIQAQVLALMRELKEKYRMTMIMITHDLGIVAEICDHVAIMYAGNVVEYGTTEEIYNRHAHPYTQALFDAIPSIDEDVEELKIINGAPPDPSDIPSGCAFHPRCPYATEECRTGSVEKTKLSETHYVCCHRCKEEIV